MSAAPKRKPAPPATLDVEFTLTGVDCGHIARAIRAVGMAASRDEGRPVLTAIKLTAKDRRLNLAATDSYRLHVADVELADDAEFEALVPAWWLVKTWPVRSMRSTQFLRIGVTATSMTITTPDGISTTAPLVADEYPNVDKLLATIPDEPNDSLTGMAFNPDFLAESCKAARLFVGPNSPHPIRCTSVEPGRPMRLDVIGAHGTLQIVLMPVRVP